MSEFSTAGTNWAARVYSLMLLLPPRRCPRASATVRLRRPTCGTDVKFQSDWDPTSCTAKNGTIELRTPSLLVRKEYSRLRTLQGRMETVPSACFNYQNSNVRIFGQSRRNDETLCTRMLIYEPWACCLKKYLQRCLLLQRRNQILNLSIRLDSQKRKLPMQGGSSETQCIQQTVSKTCLRRMSSKCPRWFWDTTTERMVVEVRPINSTTC